METIMIYAGLGLGCLSITLTIFLLFYILRKLTEAATNVRETVQDIQHKIESEINTMKKEVEENIEFVREEIQENLDNVLEEVEDFKIHIDDMIRKVTAIKPWDLVVDSVKNIFR